MSWFVPRVLIALLAMALGGLTGLLLGHGDAAAPGVFCGGALFVAANAIYDRVRGHRLLNWLRRGHDGAAPLDAGFWGELGYRIERALRASEHAARLERERLAQFLSAIEASPNGVLLLDRHHHIEWCNARAADHFGLDSQHDLRQQVTNLIRAPAFVGYLQAGVFAEPVSFRSPRTNGTLSVQVRPYGDDLKLVLSQDLTELERADSMRRDFVANVSHEIRTPLTVLSGFLETLSDLPLADAERQRVLLLMTQQADRMGRLVDDLLMLARLEGSPPPAAGQWIAVRDLLAPVGADALALSAGRHAFQFADPGTAEIDGAQSELLSALTNLVNNAVRYTPAGGRIEVGWNLRAEGVGELAVVDSGPGIAREHLPRLAERFYRVDGSRSRETGGTGLGLSIVKHVAQRHGGELEIRSEVGHGSTFHLVLPAARVRSAVARAEATGNAAGSIEATLQ